MPVASLNKGPAVLDLGPEREGCIRLSAEGILAWKFNISRPQMTAPKQWLGDYQCQRAGTEKRAGVTVIVGCLKLMLLIKVTIAMDHFCSLILWLYRCDL